MDKAGELQGVSGIGFLRSNSLTNLVQVEIERMIVEGHLQPSNRLNENELAQKLGVSRGPIREAANALAALGLIEIIPNRGFFVRSLSAEEILEASQARAGIFGYIAMMAAENASDEEIERLKGMVDQMDHIAETSDVSHYYPVNLAFHAELGAACGNTRLSQMYQNLVRELHIHRYRALSTKDTLFVSNAEHRAIIDAIAARDPQAAFLAGRAHILNGYDRSTAAQAMQQATGKPRTKPLDTTK